MRQGLYVSTAPIVEAGFTFAVCSEFYMQYLAVYCLAGLWLTATMSFGGVAPWFLACYPYLAVALACVTFLRPESKLLLLKHELYLFAGLTGLALLQLLPLPSWLLSWLAPASFHIKVLDLQLLGISPNRANPISVNPLATLEFLRQWLSFMLIYLCCRSIFQSRGARWQMAHIITAVTSCLALLGMIHLFSGSTRLLWLFDKGWVFFGPYVNKNHAGWVLCLGFALAVALVRRHRHHSFQWMMWLALAVLSLGILFTGSRIALLLWLSLVSWLVWQHKPSTAWSSASSHRWLWLSVAGGIIAIIAISIVWQAGIWQRHWLIPTDTLSASVPPARWFFWWTALKLWWQSPWLGWGLGTFSAASPTFTHARHWLHFQHAENDYLELLTGGGLLAWLILAKYLRSLMTHIKLRYIERQHRPLSYAFTVGLVLLAVHAAVVFHAPLPSHHMLTAILLTIVTPINRSLTLARRWILPVVLIMASVFVVLDLYKHSSKPNVDDTADLQMISNVLSKGTNSAADRRARDLVLSDYQALSQDNIKRHPHDALWFYALSASYASAGNLRGAENAYSMAHRRAPFALNWQIPLIRHLADCGSRSFALNHIEDLFITPAHLGHNTRVDLLFNGAILAEQMGQKPRFENFVQQLERDHGYDWRTLLLLSRSQPHQLLPCWQAAQRQGIASQLWDRAWLKVMPNDISPILVNKALSALTTVRSDLGLLLKGLHQRWPEHLWYWHIPMAPPQPLSPQAQRNYNWHDGELTFRLEQHHSGLDGVLFAVNVNIVPETLSLHMKVHSTHQLNGQLVLQIDDQLYLSPHPAKQHQPGQWLLSWPKLGTQWPGRKLTGIGFAPRGQQGEYFFEGIELFVHSVN